MVYVMWCCESSVDALADISQMDVGLVMLGSSSMDVIGAGCVWHIDFVPHTKLNTAEVCEVIADMLG